MREDRRLKALGLLLLFLAVGGTLAVVDAAMPGTTLPSWRLVVQLSPWLAGGTLLAGLGIWVLALGCGALGPRHDERRRASLKWQALLWVSCLPLGVLFLLADTPFEGWDRELVDSLASTVAMGVGLWLLHLLRRVMRHEADSAQERLALDPRAPVLYLRSFKDDQQSVLYDGGFALFARLMRLVSVSTPEQELARILGEYGPVVAIGKPDEPLPELGAARMYVAHADWQRVVLDLMRRAALVVVRVGSSAGVAWEVQQALGVLPRQRVLLAVIGSHQLAPEVAGPLQAALGGHLPAALADPPLAGWRRWTGYRGNLRVGALVGFDAAGRAHLEPVRAAPATWRGRFQLVLMSFFRPSAAILAEAWQHLLPHLQAQLPPRRPRPSRGAAVALAMVLGWTGAHWFYLGWPRRGWAHALLFPVAMIAAWWTAGLMLWMDEPEFQRRYGGGAPTRPTPRAA